jgi:hypothetical protein
MKPGILRILFFIALFLAPPIASARIKPIVVQGVDINTWPTHLTASKVLDIQLELMRGDPQTSSLVDQVIEKLNQHGVQTLSEIFSYCPAKDNSLVSLGASAFFSQRSTIAEARVSIPGTPETPWSQKAILALTGSFSSRTIKTPFIEFLMISERPEICISKGDQLLQAYNSLAHEMTHFLLIDPFYQYEELMSSNRNSDYVHTTVTQTGGELDAFKAGEAAAIRLFKKYGIQQTRSGTARFFNSDGQLINEEGLLQYILFTYSIFYEQGGTLTELKRTKIKLLEYRLKILKEIVAPNIKRTNRTDLQTSLDSEIADLNGQLLELQQESVPLQNN